MKADPRAIAAQALGEILEKKRMVEETLARQPALREMETRDRGFVSLLVLTALRRLRQIDALLERCIDTPLKASFVFARQALRLGVAQLLWLDTPPHAAVHGTVETVGNSPDAALKGLTNAVLQRMKREGRGWLAEQDEAKLSLPDWLFGRLSLQYGEETARSIALTRLAPPPIDLSAREEADVWAMRLNGTLLPNDTIRLAPETDVTALEGYAQGKWWVQDAASSLPAHLFGSVAGETVHDLCAAPGGKTAQLAAMGARVIAIDHAPRRMERLRANLDRLGLQADCVTADLLEYRFPAPPRFALLDAPCSATGTLRRHPELVWHRAPADILRLAEIQRKLLRHVARALQVGGKLIYSVCSLQPEEGEEQIARFLDSHPHFQLAPLPARLLKLPEVTASAQPAHTALRTHPAQWRERGGLDGFYAVCLEKKGDGNSPSHLI
jgi:16S rRNA (cytosine967-C5)-methyltransferase